jgi:hypothetical protein
MVANFHPPPRYPLTPSVNACTNSLVAPVGLHRSPSSRPQRETPVAHRYPLSDAPPRPVAAQMARPRHLDRRSLREPNPLRPARYRCRESLLQRRIHRQIRAALETIGITRTLLLRSSHSNGLHLYIPLPEPVKTFDLAVALEACLTAQDFQLSNGSSRSFPNPKTYGVEKIIHYNGHRLPLQPGTGSCLLDDDLNPISDQLDRFFWLWDGAASHQDIDELRHALKIGRDNRRKKPKNLPIPATAPSMPGELTSKPKSTTAGAALARPTTC